MEPEDVVDVLRHLLEALVPGGSVVDLTSVPPDGVVEVDGEIIGSLDESAFFPRATANAAALDDLVAQGVLALRTEERFPVVIDYWNGADAIADVAERSYGRMPEEVAARLSLVAGPVSIREFCFVRSFVLRK
jgi:hypothetical protein